MGNDWTFQNVLWFGVGIGAFIFGLFLIFYAIKHPVQTWRETRGNIFWMIALPLFGLFMMWCSTPPEDKWIEPTYDYFYIEDRYRRTIPRY